MNNVVPKSISSERDEISRAVSTDQCRPGWISLDALKRLVQFVHLIIVQLVAQISIAQVSDTIVSSPFRCFKQVDRFKPSHSPGDRICRFVCQISDLGEIPPNRFRWKHNPISHRVRTRLVELKNPIIQFRDTRYLWRHRFCSEECKLTLRMRNTTKRVCCSKRSKTRQIGQTIK